MWSVLFSLLFIPFNFEAQKNDQKETPSTVQETFYQETQQEGPITGRKEHHE